MNLAEILVYTDIRQLHQVAAHYGCDCNRHSKNELITTLLANMRHRETMREQVSRLSSAEAHFLLLLFLDKRTLFSLEDLMAKASLAQEDAAEQRRELARSLVAQALKRGWIFPAAGKAGPTFRVPADLREPYVQAWLDQWREEAASPAPEPVAYRDEGTALCDDIYRFLRFLAEEPVPRTAEGAMYRRYQTQLFRFLSVQEEPLGEKKWRFGYGLHFDLYPDRFSLLYDFCYYRQWIAEYPDRVEITDEGRDLLSRDPTDELHFDLIRFWMRLYKRAVPNLPMLVQLIPLMTGGEWVSQERLRHALLVWIKPFYYDDPANILINRVLKMMVHLGLLKAGQEEHGAWLYSRTYACQSWLKEYNGFAETTIFLK